MLTSETKRRIDACRDVLVGKLPLPTDQVELITLALIYKFMDDLDEESVRLGGKRSFFVNGLAQYRWRALMPQTVSAEQRMTLFAAGIEAASKAAHLPGLFRDIFRNAFLKFRDGRILSLFLAEINGFAYSHSEELGNAFEYLLQCMGTQGENGQFRTPRHIIDFMVACLDPKPTDRILDPACGTGGFLVSSFKHVLAANTSPGSSLPGDKLSHDQRQQVYRNLAGYDITDLMVKLSKVNLFLHGFPDPAIHIYDTLSNEARWHEKADLILANPPFMTPKGGVTPHAKFRVQAKKAEVLFTDYIAEHLTPEGRGGVIVPNGIVATTQRAYVQLRRFLVEDSLVAVVSLPAGVFKPYSGVKTSILFLDKALARKTDKVLFLKITADGFDLGDQRRPIEANDLPEAERIVRAWLKREMKNDELRMTNREDNGPMSAKGASPASAKDVSPVSAKGAVTASTSAKGAIPYQPGATPRELGPTAHNKGQRPAPYQPGATPRETIITPRKPGLKARSKDRVTDRSGLQPSDLFSDHEPGALPQAGMNSAIGAKIAWKLVEKRELLDNKDVTLNVERYMSGAVAEHDHEIVTIGEICVDVQSGYSCSASKQTTSGVPHLRSQNITDQGQLAWEGVKFVPLEIAAENEIYALHPGDILFNNTNSTELVGKTCLYDSTERAHYSNYTTRLRVDEARALPRFVALALHQLFKRGHFAKICTRWVGQAGVSATLLKEVEIPLPPLEEQRRIVAEIEGYQKIIDGARQILAGWKPKLPLDLKCPRVSLDSLFKLSSGKSLGAKDRLDGLYPVYGGNGVTGYHSEYLVETETLIIGRVGAYCGAIHISKPKAWITDNALYVTKWLREANQSFVAYALKEAALNKYANQGGQPYISQGIIAGIEIPFPPLDEQRRIVAELDAEAAQIETVRALIPRFEVKIQRVLDRVWREGGKS